MLSMHQELLPIYLSTMQYLLLFFAVLQEGCSVFEDDYTQDLQGKEDEEPSGLGFDMDELLSEDTLQRLQEGRDILFKDLLASEKKAYQRAVAASKFNHMIESWNPW